MSVDLMDVPYEGAWYSDAIYNAGFAMGGTSVVRNEEGWEGSYFYPYRNATREEFCAGVYAVVSDIIRDVTYLGVNVHFPDADQIKDENRVAINAMWGAGIIQGDENGYLNPKAPITRAEIATIVFAMSREFWF